MICTIDSTTHSHPLRYTDIKIKVDVQKILTIQLAYPDIISVPTTKQLNCCLRHS